MSERRRRTPARVEAGAGLAALALLLVANVAGAQQVSHAPTVVEQRARVEHHATRYREAEAAVTRARARATDTGVLDTLRHGPLVVLVDPAWRALADAGAARAATGLSRMYGVAADRLASVPTVIRPMPAVQHGDTVTVLGVAGRDGVLRRLENPDAGEPDADGRDARYIEMRLVQNGATALRTMMDAELRGWIATYLPPMDARAMYAGAFEELATSRSPLGRRCIVGDLSACREALVLREPDQPVRDWYDAAWRREFVRRQRIALRRTDATRWEACVAGDDAACDALLRASPPNGVEPPVRTRARHALVRAAVDLGGDSAFARLVDSSGRPLDERLSLAARVSADSLVAVWRERVLDAAPRRARFPVSTGLSTLAWSAFFLFLSTRSSRWR